ncbi:helix-turn-helix domain-containing protein [Amycolatopsis jiangsuensis]|uniref:DNA-binding IclR family transcriptional regulator n=2 Tax=Amycolatopsis jiangsuensis TaxID=1181879 RepID=A0A840J3J9_9PSEU|nr:helix-turn-helix domain-containing protein [Amycolatopsis jiangsuensis]MBB4689641.1 DNA-binding IclR family transcriptional regulator [Amycolatopsis jiangsuensis]
MRLYAELCSSCGPTHLSELSRRTGYAKSTTHRLLKALGSAGLIRRESNSYTAVDPRSARPAGDERLRALAPFVGDLRLHTGLTSSLAVLDGNDVVFAHRVYGHDHPRTSSDATGRARAADTLTGQLLTSGKTEMCTSARNYQGITCVGVLVPGDGLPDVALTVKGFTSRVDRERTLFSLHRVAVAITRQAPHRGMRPGRERAPQGSAPSVTR